jgi:hypothetical protein
VPSFDTKMDKLFISMVVFNSISSLFKAFDRIYAISMYFSGERVLDHSEFPSKRKGFNIVGKFAGFGGFIVICWLTNIAFNNFKGVQCGSLEPYNHACITLNIMLWDFIVGLLMIPGIIVLGGLFFALFLACRTCLSRQRMHSLARTIDSASGAIPFVGSVIANQRFAGSFVDKLPISAEGPEGDVCSVCTTAAKGEQWRVLPCNHKMHPECVDTWLNDHGTCPVCRFDVRQAVANGATTTIRVVPPTYTFQPHFRNPHDPPPHTVGGPVHNESEAV